MADSLVKINFQDIDYSGIKEGLITFLKTTQSFKDANFEGSFLSHLVNMFSYTGAIFGNYINAMASEQYIKTTQLYETGNMLGHLVGYKAHGFRGSRTSITVEPDFDAMGITDKLIDYYGWSAAFPRNTQFATKQANIKNKNLIFTNKTDAILTIKDPSLDPTGNANVISLEVVQGIPMTIDFISTGKALQSYEIPNPFVDFKEVKVYVLNDSNNKEQWDSILTWFYADSSSQVYIPYINPKGLLEIMFGEGNFGKIPEAGRTIRIEYLITSGASGNIDSDMIDSLVDRIFFVSDDYSNNIPGQFIIKQPNASSEGQNIETLNRIKKFAPFYFGIQNRLVNHFDYKWYVLGEYNFLVDAAAFNYQEAIEAHLINSPCQNNCTNARWERYTEVVASEGTIQRIPQEWGLQGFYEAYTVLPGDTLPLPKVNGESPSVSKILNYGTSSALYIDTTKPCSDNSGGIITQTVSLSANEACVNGGGCTVIHFEVEIMNPEINTETGEYPKVTTDQISLWIDNKPCYIRIDPFNYNTFGYVANECCCDRNGDVRGWYTVKGVAILDNSKVDSSTGEASLNISVMIQPHNTLLLGEVKVYPGSCLNSNDIFVVPVPESGGYLNIETKKQMLNDLNQIKMVGVRNHIIAPIYQVFDTRVIFRKDETSIISLDEVSNSIRSKIVELFLPKNRKLGDTLNTVDFSNAVNALPGVARAKVILSPRAGYLQQQAQANEIGDFQLRAGDFPILGQIQLG